MKTTSVLNRRMQLAPGAAILAALLVGAISYRSCSRPSKATDGADHVLENLQNLLGAMQSIESIYREFALTGKGFHLESDHAGVLITEQGEVTVRNLTVDNPKQEIRTPTLERLIAQKIQFGERVISLRQTAGLAPAADALRSGTGELRMGEFHDVVRQMGDESSRNPRRVQPSALPYRKE